MINRKILFSSFIFLFILLISVPCYSADNMEAVLNQWSHESKAADRDGDQEISVKATYYSNDYIEALITAEAERNLWTADEAENFKYTLLKNLNLGEAIPFHIDMYVRGLPMYAAPFDKHITMMVGKNKYQPIDYDKRFNFKILGPRDGMVFFPRYDPKTGKEILNGAKDVRIIFDSAISIAMAGKGDFLWVWDLTKDRAKIGGGKAANRLEVDRLLKRTEKINADRAELQRQLDALNQEYNEVSGRIDELQE